MRVRRVEEGPDVLLLASWRYRLLSLAVFTQSSAAQDARLPLWDEPSLKKILSELHVDEITEDTGPPVIRVSDPKPKHEPGPKFRVAEAVPITMTLSASQTWH
jgi:hypothetical protein